MMELNKHASTTRLNLDDRDLEKEEVGCVQLVIETK